MIAQVARGELDESNREFIRLDSAPSLINRQESLLPLRDSGTYEFSGQ